MANITMKKSAFISEHKHLVSLLRREGKHNPKLLAEARDQKLELKQKINKTMAKRKPGDLWIQKAVKKMKKKGTLGKFGKATAKKIAAGKKKGGLQKKRAVFAQNMKKISKGE